MSTALATRKDAVPALAMSEDELMSVLKNSLYPGAKEESIKLVIGYCKASNLDPMQKPVHIVPMSVSTGQKDSNGWDIKEMRDVVMPGIGLYRTQAARSGEYAGVSEPEFGDDTTETLDGVTVTFPKWCKVVVRRQMANGAIVDFSAKELWKENYATKSNKSEAPNAMWKKRPYAQLAKCAEAQALRKAFPEIGAQPTADEMEGKNLDDTVIDAATGEVFRRASTATRLAAPALYDQTKFDANKDTWRNVVTSGRKTPEEMIAFIESRGNPLTEDQKLTIDAWSHEND
ncbi:phage recombination protein Bet [Pandoraea apista]|uniref:Phage recombination protein Bet n=1 Tax=Pandoraea apista TaxID=93218 RepID=A0A5E5P4C8_9BURK|nr:phage recombination protein Bet [Pandoraea apista]OXS89584.1 phage recombination protein Bet [Pandoraea apista]VVG70659.1 phage recombination protein Bet [Pandoraea apista]